jgi:formylglycine-generating enzyme required for sulfatase activity
MEKPLQVFCCYAREDQQYLLTLKKHLSPIQREGLIVVQADIDISPGEEWEQKISHYLNTAQIILLLISPDFMNSDYCYSQEMKRAMERHEGREAHVIPIILRPTRWQKAPFGKLQVLPTNAEPVTGKYWHSSDDAFFDVEKGIEKVIEDFDVHSISAAPASAATSIALPGEPTPIPVQLEQLGFLGRRINGLKCILPPMVSVPSGNFLMGSDKTEDPQANSDEKPQYPIQVEAFQMGVFPVTVAEYALYLRANPSVNPPEGSSFSTTHGKFLTWAIMREQCFNYPMAQVTWFNARDYAEWLAQITGQPFRLPTEAEWEKAARGLDGQIYPWGNQWHAHRANTPDDSTIGTTPIGQYIQAGDASPYGCHDMVGNVSEWCSSLYKEYPYDVNKCEDKKDAQNERVERGGSWYLDLRYAPASHYVRAAYRQRWKPDISGHNLGFRLARA